MPYDSKEGTMREFITSDEHYGHESIIRFANRPFANAEEMGRAIIEKHNAKVPNGGSVTYHLGDMFWRSLSIDDCVSIMHRLNGSHVYVFGNHEEVFDRANSAYLQTKFLSMSDIKTVKWEKHKIVLCHYAMRVWDKSHAGSWMLYGHSHGELPGVGLSFDVGVDAHDYEPWSMEEIAAEMAKREQHHVIAPDKIMPFTELGQQQAQ